MVANVIMTAFLSIASFLIFLKRSNRTSRSCHFVFAVGFAILAAQFALAGNDQSVMTGLSLIVTGMGWVLLDAYGCLQWTK